MTDRYITLAGLDGEEITHAIGGVSDYATLCGCSGNDDEFIQTPTPRGQKINCVICKATYQEACKYRARDFE